jgi:hypothetical protein
MGRRIRALVAMSILVALSAPSAPVASQDAVSVHVEVENGVHAGEYDVTTAEPCFATDDYTNNGADAWQLSFTGDTGEPSRFTLRTGFDADLLLVGWSNGDHTATRFDLRADEVDGVASLTVQADLAADYYASGDDPDPVHVTVTVVCRELIDQRAPEPTPEPQPSIEPVAVPTPAIQGPPEPGSTVIDVSLDFGPWAGTHQAWTLDDACFASEGTWLVTFSDPLVIPWSVSLVAGEGGGEDAPIAAASVLFGGDPGPTIYLTSPEAMLELAAPDRIGISDAQAIVTLPDGTQAQGKLDATATCGSVRP